MQYEFASVEAPQEAFDFLFSTVFRVQYTPDPDPATGTLKPSRLRPRR
ncbi:MAG: hypothetical protein ACJ8AW_47030 [Rhodopila sp.]